MTSTRDELHSALSKIATRPGGYAYLGKGDGNGTIVADYSKRLLYYYTPSRPWATAPLVTSENILAYNKRELENTRVRLGYPPEQPTVLHILGLDTGEGYDAVGGITPGEQLISAQKFTDTGSLINFRIAPNDPADTEVYINPGWYINSAGDPAFWNGDSTDTLLTAAIAALSSGEHQMAAVYVNAATGAAGIVTNTAETGTVNDKELFDTTTIEEMTWADGYIPCGSVHLYDGQTSITESDIYRASDPRIVFDKTGSGGGDTLPVVDTTAIVKGSGDATKLLRFEVDGFTTATTRVVTVPDADLTLVGTATTQNLSNKTFIDGVLIDGAADEIQLQVQGNGTQTALLAVFEDSGGNDQVTISADGAVVINEEGNDVDLRVESDTNANGMVFDGSNTGGLGVGAAPNAGAALDVSSTTKIARPMPPMTAAQYAAIGSTLEGGFYYDTDLHLPGYYNGTSRVLLNVPLVAGVRLSGSGTYGDSSDFATLSVVPVGDGTIALQDNDFNETWRLFNIYDDVASGISIDYQKTPTGNTTNGSADVTGMSSTQGLVAGMSITGTGIPGGTTISLINSSTSIQISAVATATNTGVTLTCTLAASTNYDVFLVWTSTGIEYALDRWQTATARYAATFFEFQGGYLSVNVERGRYIGTIRTNASSKFEDQVLKRFVWNFYNRVPRDLLVYDTANNWGYTSTTIRQANGNAANQAEVVTGLADYSLISLDVKGFGSAASSAIGVGEDVTNAFTTAPGNIGMQINVGWGTAKLVKKVPLGYHFYSWNERGAATNTFQGDNASPGFFQTGMTGWVTA